MSPNNIKHCIVSALCITALFVNVNLSAQIRQSRVGQSNIQNTQDGTGQMSIENKQALREIEMMRQMIRERQEQHAEQRRVLQELQQVINGDAPMSTTQSQYEDRQPSYQQQERVTSGSVLSQMEAEEREDMGALQQKYNLEIQVAQKEIEMLKKQLAIANRQLDQCQSSSLSVNNNSYEDNLNIPSSSRSKSPKTVKPQKQRKVKQKTPQAQQSVEPEMSSANKQAMREIEMMRQMLQERQQQEAEQRKILQDLQRALN